MPLTLTESQRDVLDVVTEVLRRTSTVEAQDRTAAAWRGLGESGLLALALPEALGGEGFGLPEVGVLVREAGRQAVPVAFLTAFTASRGRSAKATARRPLMVALKGVRGAVKGAAMATP